jgi:hypothetical protein
MSTAEAIFKKVKALPSERQIEALHYINFLLSQEQAAAESAEWAVFSANQLGAQYSADDTIYDRHK